MDKLGNPKKIFGIEYIRGIAAVSVAASHACAIGAFPKYFGKVIFGGMPLYGYIGVDLFFVVSGFIISTISLDKNSLKPRIEFLEFFARRLIRIVPLMWLGIGSYAIWRAFGRAGPFPYMDYLRAAIFWPVGDVQPPQMWTLRHEMAFYMLFALTWLGGNRHVRWLLSLWFISPLLLYWVPEQDVSPIMKFIFSPVDLEFGFGFLLGISYLKAPDLKKYWNIYYGVFLIFVVAEIYLAYSKSIPSRTLEESIIIGLLSLIIVTFSVYCVDVDKNKFGVVLGDASYSIYIPRSFYFVFTRRVKKILPLYERLSGDSSRRGFRCSGGSNHSFFH